MTSMIENTKIAVMLLLAAGALAAFNIWAWAGKLNEIPIW